MSARGAATLFGVGTTWAQFIVGRGTEARSVDIDGLTPGTTNRVTIDGQPREVRTLAMPSGALLARVATLSDIHIGETKFGELPRIKSVPSKHDWRRAHPVWALRAALSEIREWAPDALVVKGDLSNNNKPDEYEFVAPELLNSGLRIIAMAGNHDGGNHRACDTHGVCAAHGLILDRGVTSHVVGGATVVTVESVLRDQHKGTVAERIENVAAALNGAPTLLTLHHQLLRRSPQHYIPRGIPVDESTRLLHAVASAGPRTLITSGHTHRHRRSVHRPTATSPDATSPSGTEITFSEVGSPKDYPGTWARYEIYEGGIVQTVRRIADPAVLGWTERVRRSALGVWGRWSPGGLSDRCFTVEWPA